MSAALGFWTVPIAILGGAIRVSTPFLFVSLGELVTEKSGRINLGLEGTLVMGAMSGFGVAYVTGSPWLGVLAAGLVGTVFGALHAGICSMPGVNDIAVGIALVLLGTGLAFTLGKPFVQPRAPTLPSFDFGFWTDIPQLRAALQVNVLFVIGVLAAPALRWALATTRWGLIVRMVGDSSDAARAMGYSPLRVRLAATCYGGFMAGVGGSFLSLYLSRKLERRPVQRPGFYRRGAGDLCPLAADGLSLGVVAVRGRRRARPRIAGGRRDLRLLPVQRRALRADPGHHGSVVLLAPSPGGGSGRVGRHALMTHPPTALALEVAGMSKRFGDFPALDDVSIRVWPGTVHALLGENGAGKSTLVKCIMGYYRPDAGSVLVDDREVDIDNPKAAQRLGIGMVYQHFTLVPAMTVLENLVMARAKVPAVIDWRGERSRLAAFLERMPFKIPLDTPIHGLAVGQRQKAEILKQLYLDTRFLILDEPTSVLTPQEADEMLGTVRGMAQSGRLSVLIITHKFREVLAHADAVTVLRRGRLAGSGQVAALSVDRMAAMMIGEAETAPASAREVRAEGGVRLELRALSADGADGEPAVKGVSFALRGGEILGIAGVSGNGQSQLIEVLAGQREATGGEILMHGEPYTARRAEAQKHRLALLPEEPLRNACVGRMSVAENMAFRRFDGPPFAHGVWLSHRRIRAAARELIARFRVKTSSPDAPIATLSGGNVQRAVLARELGGAVNVLVAANPVAGLDFSAVADIHAQIVAVRNRGGAGTAGQRGCG